MPRSADPAVRDALFATAAAVLTTDGPKALTTRRLATEAGTSTMAVYTYFGGMDQLRRELRQDGYLHLCASLDAVPDTEDPVADLAAAVSSYVRLAIENPARYHVLFADLPPGSDELAGAGVHDRLVGRVERCATAGRFDEPERVLAQVWAAEVWLAAHGVATLAHSRLLPTESMTYLLGDMLYRLAVGFGDVPERARASIDHGLGTPSATTTPAAANRRG